MRVTLEISDADIIAALRTASESGIGYWSVGLYKTDAGNWVVYERDARKGDAGKLLDIERGLRMMYGPDIDGNDRRPWAAVTPRWWDASAADLFVQYAAFGKLVYG